MQPPRQDTYHIWANERSAPAERVVAFESWCYAKLGEIIQWPADPRERERAIGQASHWVCAMVADLGNHGYLFQPRELATLIEGKLREVAAHQKAGRIDNIWAYLRTTWHRYVAREADKLRDRAMTVGSHVSQVQSSLFERVTGVQRPPAQSMPELMLEVARARAAKRSQAARKPAAADQLSLL